MKKVVLIFVSLILLTSCIDNNNDELGLIFDKKAYEKNRVLWEKTAYANYQFSQKYFSEAVGGQPKITSVVEKGKSVKLFLSADKNAEFPKRFVTYNKIDDLFSFIDEIVKSCEESMKSKDSHMKGADISVEYDKTYHYPTKIHCGGFYPEGYDGGLSISIEISDFKLQE